MDPIKLKLDEFHNVSESAIRTEEVPAVCNKCGKSFVDTRIYIFGHPVSKYQLCPNCSNVKVVENAIELHLPMAK